MKYQLNFSSPAVDKQKRKTMQQLTAIVYTVIWIFSGYVLFQVYSTQHYMTDVYQSRVSEIEKKISSIEPRVLFLEKRIAERNLLRNQADLYAQVRSRPSVWYARLIDLSRVLPPDLILTEVSYEWSDDKNNKNPEMTVDGYMIIRGNNQEIFAVDDLRATLSESIPTKYTYSKLLVENNRIFKEDENLKLVFSLGYYR